MLNLQETRGQLCDKCESLRREHAGHIWGSARRPQSPKWSDYLQCSHRCPGDPVEKFQSHITLYYNHLCICSLPLSSRKASLSHIHVCTSRVWSSACYVRSILLTSSETLILKTPNCHVLWNTNIE